MVTKLAMWFHANKSMNLISENHWFQRGYRKQNKDRHKPKAAVLKGLHVSPLFSWKPNSTS